MTSIPLILLAAGGSTRMGTAKQLLPFAGSTLLRHAVDTALATACRPIVVVLGAAADESRELLAGLPIEIIVNGDWQRGMGTSLRLGLQTVISARDSDAIAIMLCDQPAVTPALVQSLLAEHSRGATLIACAYNNIAGVPAVIGREWFDELLHLEDDAGARQLFKRHSDVLLTIPFPEGTLDIDTPDDHRRLCHYQREPRPSP